MEVNLVLLTSTSPFTLPFLECSRNVPRIFSDFYSDLGLFVRTRSDSVSSSDRGYPSYSFFMSTFTWPPDFGPGIYVVGKDNRRTDGFIGNPKAHESIPGQDADLAEALPAYFGRKEDQVPRASQSQGSSVIEEEQDTKIDEDRS